MHRSMTGPLVVLLGLALLLAACAGGATPTTQPPPATDTPVPTDTSAPEPTATPAPEPTATPEAEPTQALSEDEVMALELWQQLQDANYMENWATVPGKGTLYRGQGPHGMLLSTYLNSAAAEAMQAKTGTMPEQAIIVKENYMPDETLAAITVMVKRAGYDADHNDWFWTKFGPDGGIQATGKPAGCISCHGSVRSNDYIFTFPVAPIETAASEPTDEIMNRAEQLWQFLQETDYQSNWATVPGKGTLYRGQGPHGMLLSTYLNKEATAVMESKSGSMPEGAIIVKENYMPDETLAAITVMQKTGDFDPNHSNWFWVKFAADGSINAAGKPAGCISCHGSVRSNDYIFTFPIAPIPPEGPPPEVGAPPVGEAAAPPATESKEGMETGGAGELPPAPDRDEALALISKGGCAGCHTIAGVDGALGSLGPAWCLPAEKIQKGEAGLEFIRESIVDPNAMIEEGFSANIMPQSFGQRFTAEEVEILVAFIANLECSE